MTTALPYNWEQSLLSLAGEAHKPDGPSGAILFIDKKLIGRAYEYCSSLTAAHSRSFYLATALLPRDKRRAMRALYAFCRVSDNIVDCPEHDPQGRLAQWRAKALSPQPPLDNPVCLAWTDARTRYQIPQRFAEQLIDGVGRDLCQNRYATFDDLAAYSYGVASTVGLMSQHIIGFADPKATYFAIKLGVALQITNILRDVGEDWRSGRLYLPAQEMAEFGLSEADIAGGVAGASYDGRWPAFMRFQIERNRHLYRQAWPGIALLHKDGRLAVAAAADFYQAILNDIEEHNYDVFTRRAHVGSRGKLSMLPGIWWRNMKPGRVSISALDTAMRNTNETNMRHPHSRVEC